MKKRQGFTLFSLIICLVLMFGATSVCAQDTFAITVGTLGQELDINTGDEIVVPVYLSGNPGVFSYAFKYRYNPDVLELQADKMKQLGKGDYKCLINDFTTNSQNGYVNIVSLAGGKKDITTNGVITYLFFKVKDTAVRGDTEITVEYKQGNVCNYAAQPLKPKTVSGKVYVHSDIVSSAPQSSSLSSMQSNSSSAKQESAVVSKPTTLTDESSGTKYTASNDTQSQNSGKPIGYVPMETLPDAADGYYSSVIADTKTENQSTQSEIISDTSSKQAVNNDSSSEMQQTIGAEIQETQNNVSDIEQTEEKDETKPAMSKNMLIAIVIAGIVVIAAAVTVFIVSNKK